MDVLARESARRGIALGRHSERLGCFGWWRFFGWVRRRWSFGRALDGFRLVLCLLDGR
jgi:hypothetical protein